jgi:hypothetical protein
MALSPFKAKSMADQGIANPYFEDEDIASLTSLNIVANRASMH